MIRFMLHRLLWGLVVVWFVATSVFAMFFVAPHDVARLIAGRQASEQTLQLVRHRLGLDEPISIQYVRFLGRLVTADMGQSFLTGESVIEIIRRDFPVTASLAAGGAVLWMLLGVGAGVVAATRPRSFVDRAITSV